MLHQFLSHADSDRATGVFRRLARHNIDSWALTGGLAIGIHAATHGVATGRSLNDLDFVAARFEDIPETLAAEFLLRHVHPLEAPGRTTMRLVDVSARVRIDIFLAVGDTLGRAHQVELPAGSLTVVAVEDLIARAARLLLDLAHGVAVQAKHADDFLLLSRMLGAQDVQAAWSDHRKPNQPGRFSEASESIHEAIREKRHLRVKPECSKDAQAKCERCIQTAAFRLADPRSILAVFGYC